MKKKSRSDSTSTFSETMMSFKSVVSGLHKLIPGVIFISILLLALLLLVIGKSLHLMAGLSILLVLLTSIIIFGKTNSYAEASIPFIAGLLSAFTINWTTANFIAFVVIWFIFTFSTLIVASVRLASKIESIFKQASIFISENPAETKKNEKKLQSISKEVENKTIGPVERAEVIRILAFRNIPLDYMCDALNIVEILGTITQLEYKVVANIVSDIYRIQLKFNNKTGQRYISDLLYKTIKELSISPEEFVPYFMNSKSLLLKSKTDLNKFFDLLSKHINEGITANKIYSIMEKEQQ